MVTYRPIHEPWYQQLPGEAKRAIVVLNTTIKEDPGTAVPQLLDLIERFPHVPLFYNYLTVAYSYLGENELAAAATELNLERNPDYLFARMNLARQRLEDDDVEGFHRALGNALTLREMYPGRTLFHVSEFAGFMAVVAVYRLREGDWEEAHRISRLLDEIAPGEASTGDLADRVAASFHWTVRRIVRAVERGELDDLAGGRGG